MPITLFYLARIFLSHYPGSPQLLSNEAVTRVPLNVKVERDLHCVIKGSMGWRSLTPRFSCILKAVCRGPFFLQAVNSPGGLGHSIIVVFPSLGAWW